MQFSYCASPIFDLELTDKSMKFNGHSSSYEMTGKLSSTGRFRPDVLFKDGVEVENLYVIDIGIDNATFGYAQQFK